MMPSPPDEPVDLVLLMATVAPGSGGDATVLDFAAAARSRGVRTTLAVGTPPGRGIRAVREDLGGFRAEDLIAAPLGITVAAHRQAPSSLLRRARRRVGDAVRAARKAFSHAPARRRFARADVVLTTSDFPASSLAALRRLTAGRLALSHAGSVETYLHYWLGPVHVPAGTAGDPFERYAAYVRQYDALLFQAPDQRDEFAALLPELASRAHLLRPSVREPLLRAARSTPSPFAADRIAIVNVGSLQPRKQQHVSIQAFARVAARFPRADLHLVGGGFRPDYRRALEVTASSLDLGERVRFHGHRADAPRYLAHGDVVLQTSGSEGVSRVLREAMFLRRAVVAADISGTRATLANGASALLAPVGDADGFAGALSRLLARPELAERLGRSARRRYDRYHAWQTYADGVRTVLDRVTTTGRGC